ncbi:hypothetical protein K435DRAFT_879757 [Dendrothele bispora CBS 962.96]|uniref:Uncharacterized protein n=1 Tax=Dendrothele bispora (strain CBS 962.96) TaxID=1314807 RepID=A0A4S8KKP5_DENBC|nr:hypothetical protein K435DRAFT_879757 [Dendrothele bispora CBS 962.96]
MRLENESYFGPHSTLDFKEWNTGQAVHRNGIDCGLFAIANAVLLSRHNFVNKNNLGEILCPEMIPLKGPLESVEELILALLMRHICN